MSRHLSTVFWALLSVLIQSCAATDPVDWDVLTVPEDPPLQYTGDVSPSLSCL